MIDIQKILVPLDFSEYSDKALRAASEYAKRFDATLMACHVYEEPLYPADMGFGVASTPPDGVPPELEKQLIETCEKCILGGVPWQHTILVGPSPYHSIVLYAEQEKVDLIMMPTHGRTGIAHMFMGSTAERVMRRAPCPVLVMRDRADTP